MRQYHSFTQKMVLKRLFTGTTGEDSDLHSQHPGLPGDRASCWYNSLGGLEKQFFTDTGETSEHSFFCLLGDRALSISLFYSEEVPEKAMIVLCRRWYWKGHLPVKLGEDSALHIYCSGLSGVRMHQVDRIVLLRRWSEKAIHWWHWEGWLYTFIVMVFASRQPIVLLWRWSWNDHSLMTLGKRLCMFIVQVPWETEFFELVVL